MTSNSAHLFQATHPRRLIPELCSQFHQMGWLPGTSGAISIKQGDKIYVTPSGVQKERVQSDDLFMLKNDGSIAQRPPDDRKLKLSSCAPVFMAIYKERKAKAIVHSHGKYVVLASLIYQGSEFRMKNQQLIKAIYNPVLRRNLNLDEELVVPIIQTANTEEEIKEELVKVMKRYPQSNAVIVRSHGIHVWGDSWEQCKIMAESYHYLCELAVEMESLGLNEYTHGDFIPAAGAAETEVVTPAGDPNDIAVKLSPAVEEQKQADPEEEDTSEEKKSVEAEKEKTPATSTSPAKKATASPKKNSISSIGRQSVRGGRVTKRGRAGKQPGSGRGGGPQNWRGPRQPPWSSQAPGQGAGLLPSPPPMMMMMGHHPMAGGPGGASGAGGGRPQVSSHPMIFGLPPHRGGRGRGGSRGNMRGGRGGVKRGGGGDSDKNTSAKSKRLAAAAAKNVIMNY